MKLSNKTEYAILALLELGQRYGEGLVLSRDIASVRVIPESFVERILLTLRNGGIIVSVRGANGGHRLARDPGDVSVREVIELFEGSLAPIDCVNERISSLSASCSISSLLRVKGLMAKNVRCDVVKHRKYNNQRPCRPRKDTKRRYNVSYINFVVFLTNPQRK